MAALDSETRLRVGLLLIDSLDEPHRSVAGDYDTLYPRLFAAEPVEVVPYDGRNGDLPDQSECDGWIVPGSRDSVYDGHEWIEQLADWIGGSLEAKVPMVGICFGHQLIAQVLGARVERADVGWNVGAIEYAMHDRPPMVDVIPDTIRILASHQDQVLDLPSSAVLLASSQRCPVAAFSIDQHVLCLQGHPEWVPDQAGSIYASRVERLGQSAVDTALASLTQPLDRELVASWMVNLVGSSCSPRQQRRHAT